MTERVQMTEDLSVSRIVYGMWRLDEAEDTSPEHIVSKIEACLDQGITTMDQADIYGAYGAEELFGKALRAAPSLRDRIEIVTKCDIVAPMGRHSGRRIKHYDTSAAHITASVDQSLGLMGIDHIDLLLIHRPDPFMDHHETGETLDGLVTGGKVRAVGVSNFRPWDFSLLQSAMETDLVTNQIELSLTALDAFTNGDLAFLQENGIPPMAWSPLGGGGLMTGQGAVQDALARHAEQSGSDAAAVAVAWLLAHPAGILPVMGTNNLERIQRLSKAFDVPMDRETWYELYTAALGHEVP